MKKFFLFFLAGIILSSLSFAQSQEKPSNLESNASKLGLDTEKEKFSYSIGMEIGENLSFSELDLIPDLVAEGLKNSLENKGLLLSKEEAQRIRVDFQEKLIREKEKRKQELARKNQKAGQEFLSKNKQKPGVKTTSSGLQYKILQEGSGASPALEDTVTVHYKGTLLDGSVFDSSYKRGEPATFPLKGIIPGWQQALTMMKTGGKWKLFLPPKLAYGSRQAGQMIEPNSTLIFEVELLSVDKEAGEKE